MKQPDDREANALHVHLDDDLSIECIPRPIVDVGTRSSTIHVVEGTSDELVWLFDLLTEAGFRVVPFSNPFEALDSIAHTYPPVVVADFHLPDMDGLELLARIKAVSPPTRVILTSASADRPSYREVLRTGGETLIHKPLDGSVILNAVEHALNKIRGYRE
jgi:FixJ family two-component response regulator